MSYDKTLDKLAALLRKKPLTGLEIAKAMGCCKPAAYQRVRGLIDRGVNVYTVTERTKRTGPVARAFGVR